MPRKGRKGEDLDEDEDEDEEGEEEEHPDTLSTAGDLAASPAGQGSVEDIQSGSNSYAPEKPGISIASTSAAEPASKRAKQSINRAPEGRSSGAEGEQKESKVVL